MEPELLQLLEDLPAFLWPLIRVSACVMAMPIIGSSFVPARIRVLVAIALTMTIAPGAAPAETVPVLSFDGLVQVAKEVVVGVAMGFAVQLVFDAIALGGQVIAMSMGLGFAIFLDRERGINIPVLGQLFLMLGMLVFLSLNGHLILIKMLSESFELMPIGSPILGQTSILRLLEWSAQVFSVATSIALPAVAAILVVNLSFGVTSRAAPTLNLFAVGFPVAMLLGFLVVFLSMGSLIENIVLAIQNAFSFLPSLFET